MRRLHLWLLIVWALLLVPSLTIWRENLVWIVAMSHYAILATHAAGHEAERVEAKQDEQT